MNAPIQGIVYPVLPLRDIVVFPGMIVPLFVGREKSVAALENAMEGSKDIFLVAQLDPLRFWQVHRGTIVQARKGTARSQS